MGGVSVSEPVSAKTPVGLAFREEFLAVQHPASPPFFRVSQVSGKGVLLRDPRPARGAVGGEIDDRIDAPPWGLRGWLGTAQLARHLPRLTLTIGRAVPRPHGLFDSRNELTRRRGSLRVGIHHDVSHEHRKSQPVASMSSAGCSRCGSRNPRHLAISPHQLWFDSIRRRGADPKGFSQSVRTRP